MDSLGEGTSTSGESDEVEVITTRSSRSSVPASRVRKQKHPKSSKQRELKILKEIIALQKSSELLIPKAPIARVIREITYGYSNTVTHYTASALSALHEAVEMYIVQFLQDAYLLSLHRGRVTLMLQDMQLLQVLKRT